MEQVEAMLRGFGKVIKYGKVGSSAGRAVYEAVFEFESATVAAQTAAGMNGFSLGNLPLSV